MESSSVSYVGSNLKKSSGAMLDGNLEAEALERHGEDGDICHDGLLLTEALHVAHNTPDVREDMVQALKSRIEEGVYEIDAKKIAVGLIRENPELFNY